MADKSIGSDFGERVAKRREKLGYTQEKLAYMLWKDEIDGGDDEQVKKAALASKRKVIWGYENKGAHPKDFSIYAKLCAALDCDMGYLFGEYETARRENADIYAETGLSEMAVVNLQALSHAVHYETTDEDRKIPDRIREMAIGGTYALPFVSALLENLDILERIAVAAFDYFNEIQKSKAVPHHTIGGHSHEDWAVVSLRKAEMALDDLFRMIDETSFEEQHPLAEKWDGSDFYTPERSAREHEYLEEADHPAAQARREMEERIYNK